MTDGDTFYKAWLVLSLGTQLAMLYYTRQMYLLIAAVQ